MNAIKSLAVAAVLALASEGYGQPIIVDRAPAPMSIEELASNSVVVARVKIVSVKDVKIDVNPGRPPNSYIEFGARIVDPIKTDANVVSSGQTIRILASGSQLQHERDSRPFKVNEELLVFLNWRPFLNAYSVTAGPDGAFQISNEVLIPIGVSPLSRAQSMKPVSDTLQRVRSMNSR